VTNEGGEPLVVINTFTSAQDNQHHLVELLTQVTCESIVRAPGFLSATLHRSLDGRKVTMYARWRSEADYAAMRQSGHSHLALDAISKIATFEPGMYQIVKEFRPGHLPPPAPRSGSPRSPTS
jgi:quinol monooxygenase YgiN